MNKEKLEKILQEAKIVQKQKGIRAKFKFRPQIIINILEALLEEDKKDLEEAKKSTKEL